MGVFDWALGRWFGREGGGRGTRSGGDFPQRYQLDDYSCGSRSTQMVLDYYGRPMGYRAIKEELGTDEDGTSMAPIARLLRARGLAVTQYPRMQLRDLERCLRRGIVIVQVDGDHVAVVHDIDERHVYIADPSPSRCNTARQMRARFRARWDRWGMVIVDRDNGRPTPPRSVPLEVQCPATDALVQVECSDGDYTCPDCGEDITVESLEAAHSDIDTFVCPLTDLTASVPHEVTSANEYFVCPACAEPVMVREIGGHVNVLHGVAYE